jgi:hypothetical protein
MEYDTFKSECSDNVSYMTNIELLPISISLKEKIETAKGAFRKTRDSIYTEDGIYGETAARDVNDEISVVKSAYIDTYFDEHSKRRLTATDSKRKADIINSIAFANLKQLARLDEILPVSKLTKVETDLAALKVCYELTAEIMKTKHICPKCQFTLGGNEPLVKGAVEEIEDRIDTLVAEWATTLHNTIQDPLVLAQKQFLKADQQKVIDDFVNSKALPEKVDTFFITAVKALLEGFDAVTMDGAVFVDKLVALGACEPDTLKTKFNEIIDGLSKGKDKSKLRIIIKG